VAWWDRVGLVEDEFEVSRSAVGGPVVVGRQMMMMVVVESSTRGNHPVPRSVAEIPLQLKAFLRRLRDGREHCNASIHQMI